MARDGNSWADAPRKYVALALLTAQYTTLLVLVHYSRTVPLSAGGRRYIPSTAVLLSEVARLAISTTGALYEISATSPPTLPATSLLGALGSGVLGGDSWSVALPALCHTLATSLLFVALANAEVAAFQMTFQFYLAVSAVLSFVLLRKNVPLAKCGALMVLLVGVSLINLPSLQGEEHPVDASLPRSIYEFRQMGPPGSRGQHHRASKRSATYEGIHEDAKMAFPEFNDKLGLISTVGAAVAAAAADVLFEKVLRDTPGSSSSKGSLSAGTQTSLWIRNVQLALYSFVPALFVGVVFIDGAHVSKAGFFYGYDGAVVAVIALQTVGSIAATFSFGAFGPVLKMNASSLSAGVVLVLGVVAFKFRPSAAFIVGAALVLAATYVLGHISVNPLPDIFGLDPSQPRTRSGRPRPHNIDLNFNEDEKRGRSRVARPRAPSAVSAAAANETENGQAQGMGRDGQATSGGDGEGCPGTPLKLPMTPLTGDGGLSTSRPTSPNVRRSVSGRGFYFETEGGD